LEKKKGEEKKIVLFILPLLQIDRNCEQGEEGRERKEKGAGAELCHRFKQPSTLSLRAYVADQCSSGGRRKEKKKKRKIMSIFYLGLGTENLREKG